MKIIKNIENRKEFFNSKETPNMEPLLNINETSELLKLKVSTLYTWVNQKKIPHIKMHGKLCFDLGDIKTFINVNRVA